MYILAQIFHYNFDERFGLNPRGMGMPQIFQNFYVRPSKGSQQLFLHGLLLFVCQIYLFGIHSENTSKIRAAYIFGYEMKVQMLQCV